MWSKQNPHFWEQVVTVMSQDNLIGPFFITGRLNSDAYVYLLQTQFLPELQRRGIKDTCHFQQDGAPAHTALNSRNFLNTHFPDRWVGKFGSIQWPPRSPDLTSCDNSLWWIIKPKVLRQQPHTAKDIRSAAVSYTHLTLPTTPYV